MTYIKLRYFFYGIALSASIITITTQATGGDGVFGDYFQNMTLACPSDNVITGFASSGPTYGTRICHTVKDLLGSVFGSLPPPPLGQAMIGFDTSGNPKYKNINWSNSGSNIYYTGGNVGIGKTDPIAKLTVSGSVLANDICLISGDCLSTAAQKTDPSGYPVLYNLTVSAWQNMNTQTIRDQWYWYHSAGCASFGTLYGWAATTIATCKANTDGDIDAVIGYGYQPAIIRAIQYVKRGGAPDAWLPAGCLSAPNLVLCTQGWACGVFDTYQPAQPAFLSVSCIGTP